MDDTIFEHIQTRVETDEEQQKLFQAYDDMDTMKWEPPASLLKDWVRIRISTAAHDALKQMANIFDTHNPKWEILPLGEADSDRAEELETWLEYHAAKANLAGETSPFRKGLHNSGKFNRCIYHVDYLPYWLPADKKKWNAEQKANAASGPFCITAVDPRCMFYEIGKYGLKWVANVSNMDAQDIIDHWSVYESTSDEGEQIKSGLSKLKAMIDEDEETELIYVDYTSNDKRCVSVYKCSSEGIDDFCDLSNEDGVSILDGENKIGFIPYAVATGDSDPLLHSLHVGGIWENQNMIDTIVDSSVLRRAFFPLIKHTSVTNKDIDINYDGSQDVVELGQGEDAQTLNPPPIDTGLQQLVSINSQKMGQTVGIKNLGLQDIAGNVQFSTVQAQIQLQLTALQPYKRTAEKALSHVALLMFKWLKFSGKTEIGYRTKTKKEDKAKGQGIVVGPEDFSPDDMIITCELLSNSPTDKQQLVNMYSTLKQAGAQVSWGELLERLGLGNPEQLKLGWMDEQLESAALKNFVDEMALKLQLQGEQKRTEIQMAAQAQQAQQQQQMQQEQMAQEQQQAAAQEGGANPPQGDPTMPQGQMNNPAAGGQPPMASAPGMTRNNVRQPG